MTGAGTVAAEIAHLRRHAHALTGNWARGDDFARSALQETARDVRSLMLASSPRVGLYRCFHRIWSRSDEPAATARGARCRESLLLASGEKFQPGQVAEILEVPMGMVQGLVRRARSEAQARRRKAVVVLTDAPEGDAATSAMLTQTPLRIAGVARTAGGALALARTTTPDLLIADCRDDPAAMVDLAASVLARVGTRPVLFLAANPATLLRPDLPAATWILPMPCRQDQFHLTLDQLLLFDAGVLLTA